MANRLFARVFGTRFDRALKRIQPIVDAILEHEVRLKDLTDSELQAQTAKFREAIAERTGEVRAEVERLKQAKHDCPDPEERANLSDQLRKAEQEFVAALQRALDELLPEAFATVREAARRLRDGGRIVNFSSSITSSLQPTYGVYAATKAAVEAMVSILAKELRGRNITVNAIAPGPTATKLFLDGKPQEVIERLAKLAPLERLGQPQDIADAVAFLAGPDGAWINGQTLRANGGII